MNNLLNLLFPEKCLFCGFTGSIFCPNCLSLCPRLKESKFYVGDLPVVSCFSYEGIVRKCIKLSKFSSKQFLALKRLTGYGLSLSDSFSSGIVVPIPLSKKRLRERGFNQAEIIAKLFSQKYKLPIDAKILVRSKITSHQYGLSKSQRHKNLCGAFEVRGKVSGMNIILIDDICTTGSTLLEAAKVFKAAGASDVAAFTLCRRIFKV